MSDLYSALGVDRKAGVGDIKKSYMRLVKEHHPDRGGNAENFRKIQQAYEILTDEDKRRMYDMTGQIPGEGPQVQEMPHGMGGFPFPININEMFGMFGGGGQQRAGPVRKAPKGPPKTDRLPLSLEQFYYGHTIRMSFDRLKLCAVCAGSGAASKMACGDCRGSGQVMRTMTVGPAIMHSVGPCGECKGTGDKIAKICTPCGGKGRTQEMRNLEVAIEPGMGAGDQLRFEGACSESLEYELAGDVYIILELAESATGWVRKGSDLHLEVVIGLTDSLVGCMYTLEDHPKIRDGEEPIMVSLPAGVVTGDVLRADSLGMPVRGNKELYGNLYLTVKIMPTEEERKALRVADVKERVCAIFGTAVPVVDEKAVAVTVV